jgi:uncharacterized membrane protein (DUF4010 family)
MLGEQFASVAPFVCGIVIVALTIIAAYLRHPDPSDPGTTSVAARAVCYCLGAATWLGHAKLALGSGLTDVDSITLSSLRLFALERLQLGVTVIAIGIAMLANLGFKLRMAVMIGGRELGLKAAIGMGAVALGLVAGILWVSAQRMGAERSRTPWEQLSVGTTACGRSYLWEELPVGGATCGRSYLWERGVARD